MTRWAAAASALAAVLTAFCIAVVAGIAAAVVVVSSGGPLGSGAASKALPAVRCPSGRLPDRLVVHHPGGVAAYVICTLGRTASGVVGVGDVAFVWGMASARVDADGAVLVAIAVPGGPAVPVVFSASGLLDPPATAAAMGRARLGAVQVAGGVFTDPALVTLWAVS